MYKYCAGCIFRHGEDSGSLCDMVENRNYNADEEKISIANDISWW